MLTLILTALAVCAIITAVGCLRSEPMPESMEEIPFALKYREFHLTPHKPYGGAR